MTSTQGLLFYICHATPLPLRSIFLSIRPNTPVPRSSFAMMRLSTIRGLFGTLTLLLLTLQPLQTGADTAYVNFSPAIYLFDNFGQSSPSQTPLPSPPSPPPSELTTAVTQWVYPGQYSSPAPQATLVTETVAGQLTPNTIVWVEPAPSPTVPFEPATPIATFSCAAIGEPWWACLNTERCSFDDAGSIACCPVGDFCKGVASYGNGAGPRPGLGSEFLSGGEKGVNISRDILIGAVVLQAVVVGYWVACTVHEGTVSYFVGITTGCVVA